MKCITVITFLLTATVTACDFVGMCPSNLCAEDSECPQGHVCGLGQCVLPCQTVGECPAGDGPMPRCYDPQDRLGFRVCADVDGVPGQACEIATDSTTY